MHFSIKYFTLILLPILMAVGCSDEYRYFGEYDRSTGSISLSYSVKEQENTRSEDASASESVIDHAYLLFFNNDGQFVASACAKDDVEYPGNLHFDLPEALKENTSYSLVALANADEYSPAGFNNYQSYLESFTESPLVANDNRLLLYTASLVTPKSVSLLPMKGSSVFSFSQTTNGIKINGNLRFERLVSRIDIINAVENGFNLQSTALCNWRDSYAPLASGSNTVGELNGILTQNSEDCTFVGFPATNESGTNQLAPAFYCFPSMSEKCEQGDKTTTALILKAQYDTDTNSSYYRVNIGENGKASELKNNYCYRLKINSVRGTGKPTAKEAYESKEPSPIEGPGISIEPVLNTADVSHLYIDSIIHPTATTRGKIVIDGFDPESFNSFIDIPFKIKLTGTSATDVTVSSTLEWPLEGAITNERYKGKYYYCPESFTDNSVVNASNVIEKPKPFELPADNTFYISVGAMAPDDPAIERTFELISGSTTVTYDLIIRPRPVIINDVIIEYQGTKYLIADRNYQEYGVCPSRTCWEEGKKKQAYHYCSFDSMKIPFKSSNEQVHKEMLGYNPTYSNRSTFQSKIGQWKKINTCDDSNCESPFYTSSEIEKWGYVFDSLFEEMKTKVKVSKMRMFLISDEFAMEGDKKIYICCYIPYFNSQSTTMEDNTLNSNSGVYFLLTGFKNIFDSNVECKTVRCNQTEIEIITMKTKRSNQKGCVRPARILTDDEYNDYLANYLGHNGGTLKLSPCKPDIRE